LLPPRSAGGLFTTAAHATDIPTRGGTYRARHTVGSDTVPLTMTLSNALQQAPRRDRGSSPPSPPAAALPPRRRGTPAPHHTGQDGADDGPARHRRAPAQPEPTCPRTMGLIKSHRAGYLPPELNQVVAALTAGQRNPRVPDGHYVGNANALVPPAPVHPGRCPGAPMGPVSYAAKAATDLSRAPG